jgi:putative DNA methylase
MITPPYRKKLIEVSLPLKAINEASAREKSIRHGHPSTLHLWWARRPLAACRAVLFASLVDDPSSDPDASKLSGETREHWIGEERARLHRLIEQLVPWENSNNRTIIRAARAEIARCVASLKVEQGELKNDTKRSGDETVGSLMAKGRARIDLDGVIDADRLPDAAAVDSFLAEHAPPVLDPFCGGGSIPLEAQRLGLRAYASDLNPVAVLITKALIEIPTRFAGREPVNPDWQSKSPQEKALVQWHGAQGLAEDVRYYGKWMRDEAEKRIGHLYPKVKITAEMATDRPGLKEYVGQELTVIAWVWARTVASPNPACRAAHVPLVRSFWLSTKKGKEAYVRPALDRAKSSYRFEVYVSRPGGDFNPSKGTVGRTGGVCLLSGTPISLDYIRTQGRAGRIAARLMAIVLEGQNRRVYLAPTGDQEDIPRGVVPPAGSPETELPEEALGFRVQNYGMTKHKHLFTNRQLTALTTFTDLVDEARARILSDSRNDARYADAITSYLGLVLSKCADYWSNLCIWRSDPKNLGIGHVFSRNAVSMIWDFAEGNPFSNSSGSWGSSQRWTELVLRDCYGKGSAEISQLAAIKVPCVIPSVCSTDPPYYDNVPYADLSDFFYVWLRSCLRTIYPELLGTVLVPKADELVADAFRHGGKDEACRFFERGMARVVERLKQTGHDEYPTTIYYAFKQSEEEDEDDERGVDATPLRASTGWETFLQGIVDTGWHVDGTWPMRTELGNRTRSMGSNALASSIVLVCRPRPLSAGLAGRKEFMSALRQELPEALRNLQYGNIAPVDLAQAAIGPGMAVFTRYAKVIESDGSPMTVRTALGIINQVLDEVLAEQEGDFDPDTRWALAWFEQFGAAEGPFGVAETLSKAKNTAVGGLVEAGIVKARGGKVQLLGRSELPKNWDPTTDRRLTVWETTQHLIRTLEQDGESGAAALLNKLGGIGETARELAYRLYAICERKKWADEALAYNGLVIAWPELAKLALAERSRGGAATQQEMF